jgi:universal stress protein A
MANYRRVLCAIDLTDESREVLDRARDEAAMHGAELSIISVLRPFATTYGIATMPGDLTGQLAQLQADTTKQMRQRMVEIGREYGVPPERQYLPEGQPAYEVHRVSKEAGIDLVVIGSHGRHGLGLLLGSTANAVLHGAKTDVLAVRVRSDQ